MPFEPPFPIDHLHEGDRNRILQGQLTSEERDMLTKGEDPWRKFRGPEKEPPPKPLPLSTGTGVPGQRSHAASERERQQREQEKIEAEVVESMHPQDREKYKDPETTDERRKAIFETYKDKLEENKRREDAEFKRELNRTVKAQELLRRIKGDPSKAHLPLPADNSKEALLKWYDEISKPSSPPFYESADGGKGTSIQSRQLIDGAATEMVEPSRNISLSVDENLRPPQEVSLQVADDLHTMGKVVNSAAANPTDKPWHKRGDLVLAVVLALGAAVLGIAVILLPPTSVRAIIFWLAVLFLLLSAAEFLVARYREWSWFKTVIGIFLLLVVVVIFGWFAWPEPKPQASVEKRQTEVNAVPSAAIGLVPTIYEVRSNEYKRSSDYKQYVVIWIVLGIRNNGAPVTVGNFRLDVQIPERSEPVVATQVVWHDSFTFRDIDGKVWEVDRSNMIEEKVTESPIQTGAEPRGLLLFSLQNVKYEEIKPGTILKVSFVVNGGTVVTCSYRSTWAIDNVPFQYIPGIKAKSKQRR